MSLIKAYCLNQDLQDYRILKIVSLRRAFSLSGFGDPSYKCWVSLDAQSNLREVLNGVPVFLISDLCASDGNLRINLQSTGTVRLDLRNLKNVHTPDASRTTSNTIKPIFKR